MKPPSDRGSGGRGGGGGRDGGRPSPGGGPPRDRPPGGPPRDRKGGPRGPGHAAQVQAARGQPRPAGQGPAAPRTAAPEEGRKERLQLPARAPDAPRPQTRPQGPRPPSRPPGGGHPDRRATEAPKGTVWLYGIHAVAAALGNPARRIRRLVLTEDAEAGILAQLPQPWPMQPERADRAKIEHILGRDAVHQGAALLVDPLIPPSLAQALERPGPVLVLDQVTDPRNVGAILRSAAAFGVAAIITQERNSPEETGAMAKAASGALEKVPMFKAVNISRTLVALKAAGLWCVGLDASGAPLSGPGLSDRRVALVLGAEGEGLRRLTRETCDELAGLAVPIGHASAMESLNVSAATAIALYEVQRKA